MREILKLITNPEIEKNIFFHNVCKKISEISENIRTWRHFPTRMGVA
jgi:hypothetical protein